MLLRKRERDSTYLRPTISFVSKKHSMTCGRTARPLVELKTYCIKTRALDTPPVAFCVFILAHVLSSSLASRKQAFSERPKPYSSDWLAVATVSMQSGVRLNLNYQICLLQIIMTYQYRDHQLCQKLVE